MQQRQRSHIQLTSKTARLCLSIKVNNVAKISGGGAAREERKSYKEPGFGQARIAACAAGYTIFCRILSAWPAVAKLLSLRIAGTDLSTDDLSSLLAFGDAG